MQDLKQLRKAKKLTQSDVAKQIGVSQQAYAKYENGDVVPNDETLAKLYAIFGASECKNGHLSKGCGGHANVEEFLNKSYTAYHSVLNAVSMLEDWGFERINDKTTFKEGGKYYLTKNSSAVIAFKIGDLSNYAFMIAGSHTDSPCFRVKGNALLDSAEGKRFNVEKYGGMLMYSFLDIPLKLAGRIFVKTANGVQEQIVESDRLFNIPSLCIHHNPNANEGLTLTVQNDMCPLVGEGNDVYSFVSNENVLDADLFVSPAIAPFESGKLLCSPRIDNLTSVYASLKAIKDCSPKGIAVACCFDNEEIGSETKQGAGSALLEDVLRMINRGLCKNEDDFVSACKNGFVLSIDNGHAVHPAHPEKSDPLNKVYLGGGIVVKHHTHYSSDGLSSAVVKAILLKANVPHQDYYNNSDVRCGGTIGLITSKQLAMNACDIGLAELAMHSSIETVDKSDIAKMETCVRTFFDTSIHASGDDIVID